MVRSLADRTFQLRPPGSGPAPRWTVAVRGAKGPPVGPVKDRASPPGSLETALLVAIGFDFTSGEGRGLVAQILEGPLPAVSAPISTSTLILHYLLRYTRLARFCTSPKANIAVFPHHFANVR